jgi:tol-pal system protein YbgF
MREAISRVQSNSDGLDQRLANVEIQRAERESLPLPPQTASASAKQAKTPVTPSLRVVRIAPQGEEPAAPQQVQTAQERDVDPEENSPRPMVRIIGSGSSTGSSRKKGRREADSVEVVDPEGLPSPIQSHSQDGRPSALDPAARRSYEDALSLVYAKKYDAALDAFAAFLVKWPDHPNADNAHYWRGECYFAKGEFARAEEQFAGVLRQFPLGNKISDSLLKLAITQEKLGKNAEAKGNRERLLRDYPKSDAAKHASVNRGAAAASDTEGSPPAPRPSKDAP